MDFCEDPDAGPPTAARDDSPELHLSLNLPAGPHLTDQSSPPPSPSRNLVGYQPPSSKYSQAVLSCVLGLSDARLPWAAEPDGTFAAGTSGGGNIAAAVTPEPTAQPSNPKLDLPAPSTQPGHCPGTAALLCKLNGKWCSADKGDDGGGIPAGTDNDGHDGGWHESKDLESGPCGGVTADAVAAAAASSDPSGRRVTPARHNDAPLPPLAHGESAQGVISQSQPAVLAPLEPRQLPAGQVEGRTRQAAGDVPEHLDPTGRERPSPPLTLHGARALALGAQGGGGDGTHRAACTETLASAKVLGSRRTRLAVAAPASPAGKTRNRCSDEGHCSRPKKGDAGTDPSPAAADSAEDDGGGDVQDSTGDSGSEGLEDNRAEDASGDGDTESAGGIAAAAALTALATEARTSQQREAAAARNELAEGEAGALAGGLSRKSVGAASRGLPGQSLPGLHSHRHATGHLTGGEASPTTVLTLELTDSSCEKGALGVPVPKVESYFGLSRSLAKGGVTIPLQVTDDLAGGGPLRDPLVLHATATSHGWRIRGLSRWLRQHKAAPGDLVSLARGEVIGASEQLHEAGSVAADTDIAVEQTEAAAVAAARRTVHRLSLQRSGTTAALAAPVADVCAAGVKRVRFPTPPEAAAAAAAATPTADGPGRTNAAAKASKTAGNDAATSSVPDAAEGTAAAAAVATAAAPSPAGTGRRHGGTGGARAAAGGPSSHDHAVHADASDQDHAVHAYASDQDDAEAPLWISMTISEGSGLYVPKPLAHRFFALTGNTKFPLELDVHDSSANGATLPGVTLRQYFCEGRAPEFRVSGLQRWHGKKRVGVKEHVYMRYIGEGQKGRMYSVSRSSAAMPAAGAGGGKAAETEAEAAATAGMEGCSNAAAATTADATGTGRGSSAGAAATAGPGSSSGGAAAANVTGALRAVVPSAARGQGQGEALGRGLKAPQGLMPLVGPRTTPATRADTVSGMAGGHRLQSLKNLANGAPPYRSAPLGNVQRLRAAGSPNAAGPEIRADGKHKCIPPPSRGCSADDRDGGTVAGTCGHGSPGPVPASGGGQGGQGQGEHPASQQRKQQLRKRQREGHQQGHHEKLSGVEPVQARVKHKRLAHSPSPGALEEGGRGPQPPPQQQQPPAAPPAALPVAQPPALPPQHQHLQCLAQPPQPPQPPQSQQPPQPRQLQQQQEQPPGFDQGVSGAGGTVTAATAAQGAGPSSAGVAAAAIPGAITPNASPTDVSAAQIVFLHGCPTQLPSLSPGKQIRVCGVTFTPAISLNSILDGFLRQLGVGSLRDVAPNLQVWVPGVTSGTAPLGFAAGTNGGAGNGSAAAAAAAAAAAQVPAAAPTEPLQGVTVAVSGWPAKFQDLLLNEDVVRRRALKRLGLTSDRYNAPLPEAPVDIDPAVVEAVSPPQSADGRQWPLGPKLVVRAGQSIPVNSVLCIVAGCAMSRADSWLFRTVGFRALPTAAVQGLKAFVERLPEDAQDLSDVWQLLATYHWLPSEGQEAGQGAGRPAGPVGNSGGPLELTMLGYGNAAALIQDPELLRQLGGPRTGPNCMLVPLAVRGLVLPAVVAFRQIGPGEQLLMDRGPVWRAEVMRLLQPLMDLGIRPGDLLRL